MRAFTLATLQKWSDLLDQAVYGLVPITAEVNTGHSRGEIRTKDNTWEALTLQNAGVVYGREVSGVGGRTK